MRVMLDTNICMYLIKKQPPAVLEHFKAFPVGDIGISIITWAESFMKLTRAGTRHVTEPLSRSSSLRLKLQNSTGKL